MNNIRPELGLSVVKRTARHSTSRLCGFIVCGKEHANVRKVLDDKYYWDEFDKISGPNWPIFTLRPLERKQSRSRTPEYNPGMVFFMCMISEEYEPDGNKMILDFLGIDDSSLAPCFVLFTWDEQNNLVSTAYKFSFETVDEVHNELRGLIEAISNAERHILPEYKRNIETYIQARDAADAYLAEKRVKRIKKALLPGIKHLLDAILND